MVHLLGRVGAAAFGAVGAQDAAVQLQNVLAAGGLVQPVDILRDDGAQLSLLLQLGQTQMGAVGLDALDHQLFPVKAVILCRVTGKKACAEDLLRRIAPLLVVQAVHAAEIGDAALRADAGAAEEDHVIALVYPFFQGKDSIFH